MAKIFYKISELNASVNKLYNTGIVKGVYVGFNCLDNLYSIKLGCTTYIMGSPTSGKTELWFEFLINTSEFYDWKHVIFTPETGSKEEIVAELISKHCRKPFYGHSRMTEMDTMKSLAWLDDHFYIIDPSDESLTPEDFFKTVSEIEKTYNVKIQTTTLDPYNELKHSLSEHNNRQDLYIEELLGLVRRNARANNRHNCIITHAADQMPITDNGITYYPAPTPRQYAGGQAWYRKGLAMLTIWRPPVGLSDSNGNAYEANEAHVIIHKAKPKGIGEKGTAKLYFDIYTNRYYERLADGTNKYSSEAKIMQPAQENRAIYTSKNYYEPDKF